MKRLLIVLIAIVLTSSLVYFKDPDFWGRYLGLMQAKLFKTPRGKWYSPLADVVSEKGQSLLAGQAPAHLNAAIDQVEAYVAERNSFSFAVWHDGKLLRETYFGDTQADTLIVSKSLAKPLASILVARAFQQGYFTSLDQSASEFIQEWQGTDKTAITLRHILNMTSGLERYYRNTSNPFNNFHQSFLGGNHTEFIINELPLQDDPGSYYDYSQATSELVSVLIERATGQRFEDYLSSELLTPLQAAGGEIWLNRKQGTAHSGCCVMLPSDTWLRLGVLMAQDGVWNGVRLLPEWWQHEILKGSVNNPNYSLYFWLGSPHSPRRHFVDPNYIPNPGILQSQPYAADDVFMFDGNGSQVIYIVPSRKLVILRTGGWPPKDADGNEWDNSFLANTIINAIDKPVTGNRPEAPPPFSAAMQHYQPLGKVAGKPGVAFKAASDNDNPELAAAIELADAANSYALLVWHNGELKLEKYFSDFDKGLRPETASMHKSVMSLLFLAAQDDGHIKSLDEPIGQYIEQLNGKQEGNIPIRALLTMSSGLMPLSKEGGEQSPRIKFFTDGKNARSTLLAMKSEVAPYSRFLYANTNSQLLCMVLEAAVGQPYAEYLSERLWQKIGADDAYVWHYESGGQNTVRTQSGFPRTYASLLARPRDWLRLGLLIKNDGVSQGRKVISKASMSAFSESSKTNINYGLHVWLGRSYQPKRFYNDDETGPSFVSKEPFRVDDMIYFDGIGGQRVYISKKSDLVIVRVGDLRFDWDDTALPNLVIDAISQ